MVKAQDFRLPFSWEERKACVHEKLWYLPEKKDSSFFIFPGWHSDVFFGNMNPVHIEYCSGNGSWILEKAQMNPEINWVAVEKQFDRARKIWAKIHNLKLSNCIVCWAEGLQLTKQFLHDETIHEIYINFPDPWPKRRHAQFRIVSNPFLLELKRILKKDGHATVVTDDKPYSQIIIKEFSKLPKDFSSTIEEPYFSEPPSHYGSSFFEELFRLKGKNIHYHRFKRV